MMNDTLTAGDTLDFYDDVAAYLPSAGWTLKYRLVPRFTSPAQDPVEITAVVEGDRYRVQAAAAITAAWKPGFYTWARWVEQAGPVRQSLGSGQLEIKADPSAAAAGLDTRSHARKMLDQIEAALQSLNYGTKAYTIGTRSWTKVDMPELITLRDRYRWEVQNEIDAERVAAGMGNPRIAGVRFTRV